MNTKSFTTTFRSPSASGLGSPRLGASSSAAAPLRSWHCEFVVDQSPKAVFDAVNDVRAWWSPAIEGKTDRLGEEFVYTYKTLHRTRQKITEHVPEKKVVWRVVESHIDFVKDKGEWNGTDIVFEIAPKGAKTELRFTHVGLSPEVECYDACRKGWTFYVQESLRKLIETGKGTPNP